MYNVHGFTPFKYDLPFFQTISVRWQYLIHVNVELERWDGRPRSRFSCTLAEKYYLNFIELPFSKNAAAGRFSRIVAIHLEQEYESV